MSPLAPRSFRSRAHHVLRAQQRTVHGITALFIAVAASCGGSDTTSAHAPSATSLAILHAASHSLAKHALDTVRVEVRDAQGNRFTTSPVTVTLSIAPAAGGGAAVAGPFTAVASAGVASFVGISVAEPGAYLLSASASGLASVSQPLAVTPEPVVIDSSVLRLVSDSASRAAGTYVFTGTGTQAIDTGRVLAGAQGGGFLRRVTSVERAANTVTAHTVQASLSEVIQNDSIIVHMGLAGANLALRGARLGPGGVRFRPASAAVTYDEDGTISLTNLTLVSASGAVGLLVSSATLDVQPAIVLQVYFGDLLEPLKAVKVGVTGTVTFAAATTLGFVSSFSQSGSFLLGTSVVPTVVPPGIPVVFETPITLEWQVGADGRASISMGWSSTATETFGADWTSAAGWQPYATAGFDFTPQFPTPQINASASAHLGVQFKPRIVVAGVAGGDVYAQPFAEGNAKVDLVTNSWSTSCRSAIALGLDLDLKIVSLTLASYSRSTELGASTWPICAHSGSIFPVTVTVVPASLQLLVGDQFVVAASVTGSADKTVVWSSSDPTVAAVDATGFVHALAAGTAQIIARHPSGATGSCAVTVTKFDPGKIFIRSITTASGQSANPAALQGLVFVAVEVQPAGHTIKEVDLLLDGQVVARSAPTPTATVFSLPFDTRQVANGTHRLQALVSYTDISNLVATDALIVTVKN